MTSAEDQSDQLQDAEVDEESGGPFVRTTGGEERRRHGRVEPGERDARAPRT